MTARVTTGESATGKNGSEGVASVEPMVIAGKFNGQVQWASAMGEFDGQVRRAGATCEFEG